MEVSSNFISKGFYDLSRLCHQYRHLTVQNNFLNEFMREMFFEKTFEGYCK